LAQVVSQENLISNREGWKANRQCVVFVGGRFDLLHPGHIRLLEQARSHGDILVVGVQGDEAVRAHASESPSANHGANHSRPITPAAERAEILAALAAVDYVVEYDDPSADNLIARLAPDIVVEGGSPLLRTQAPPAEPTHTRLVRILLEPGFSTTRLIERVQQTPA
jgi:D-glycero-beta-D-manno-heptose 1-phosphate adenylyltransferase